MVTYQSLTTDGVPDLQASPKEKGFPFKGSWSCPELYLCYNSLHDQWAALPHSVLSQLTL